MSVLLGRRNRTFRLLFLVLLAVFTAAVGAAQTSSPPRAIVVDAAGPWQNSNWTLGVTQFTSLLTDAGYHVDTVSPVDLPAAGLTPDVLLAVPSIESLPLASFKAIAAYAAAGGTLMASGGEPFRDPLYLAANGQWLDQNTILQALTPEKTILDPLTAVLTPVSDVPQTVTQSTVTGPDGQSKVVDFQLQVPTTGEYYLLTASPTKPVFNAGQTATIVWTRGTPGQSMVFLWVENDGSRWASVVPLTTQWTKQVRLPGDFQNFNSPARAGTTFKPAQANMFYFGVATGLGAAPGPVEFAVSAISAATAPVLGSFSVPVLQTLSPSYEQYVTQRAGQTVRVPVLRGRGLSATADPDGRYRVIGDPLSPTATWYVANNGPGIIWLPWPQLTGPDRSQLVAWLSAAPNRLHVFNAGPTQVVFLPSEDIILGARVGNMAQSSAQANLVWSIADSMGAVITQFTTALNLSAGQVATLPPTDAGPLPVGDYTVTASLVTATQEVDRIDSRVRVFDPTPRFQPDQRIVVANGGFSTAAGRRLFLQGVNYWPRYAVGLQPGRFAQSWLLPQNYDPDIVEADLTALASLNFNLVSIQYYPYVGSEQGRNLADFLDRCRNHGLWANIYFPAFTSGSPPAILDYGESQSINPNIASILQAAFLPGNDRVFAYDMLWEPVLGLHNDRLPLDTLWRTWITDQYGSLASAEGSWGFTAPRDAQGQLSNPLDNQIENDGPWRVMVAAYRRFVDDILSRSMGAAARAIRSVSPGTLLSYRLPGGVVVDASYALTPAGQDMLSQMAYELGTAAAHLDFISPHAYEIPTPWPAGRGSGFAGAYARYRTGGKPVYWSEYGLDIGATGTGVADQATVADSVMRLSNDDGSGGASVWWMPGGWYVTVGNDYGILNPDGTPRQSAQVLSQFGATFRTTPPAPPTGTPVTLTVDRDADARGDVGLFLRWTANYFTARQAGNPVFLKDAGTGSDTSTMPLMQVGNVAYAGSGPLKYANGEFAGIHIQCPGLDVTIENGASVQVPVASTCQITPSLINTGSATWLPAAQAKGGVVLHTSAGDLPLQNSLAYLQRVALGPLPVAVGQGNIEITARLNIQGLGPFGEILHLTLQAQPNIPPPALLLNTSTLPNGLVGMVYSQLIGVSGGITPYTWSVTGGSLPPGLQLENDSGRIEGTPTSAGSFTFTVAAADSIGQHVTDSFTIGVTGGGVVSGASFLPALAPGAIASILGSLLSDTTASASTVPLPTVLGGTRVVVNGIPAPLFFVSPNQVNFQIPFEAPLLRAIPITVQKDGLQSLATMALVVPDAPAIFTYLRTPNDLEPVITHADGSLVAPGNVANANEVLIAYATGVGDLNNPPATGAASPVQPPATARVTPTITVGAAAATPIFTGLAPGLIGVVQFNFQLPAGLPVGPFVPLTIHFGDASSPTVNLAVP